MKKSNKLILGALLTGILILTGIHIALSARYKAGNFTAYDATKDEKDMEFRALANIREVRVENVGYVTVRYNASPSIKYTKGVKNIKVTEEGGVMVVTLPKRNDGEGSSDASVHLNVDSSLRVSLINSRAYLVNTGERNSHLNMAVNDTYLTTSDDVNTKNFFLGSLQLTAVNKSEVRLNGINIARMALNIQKSTFVEDKSTFEQMQVSADDSSRISLRSAHLLKLTKANTNE